VNAGFEPSASVFNAMPVVFVLLLVGVIAFMIVSVVFAVRSSRRRHESIATVVMAHGLSYVAKDSSLVNEFVGDPFGKGSARRAADVVAGDLAGGWLQTFAYSYETESTDANGNSAKTTHRFQVTWIPLPAPFPHVRITPDTGWLRALGALGGHDLNTESSAFNARWRVRANDERIAHAILTGPMIERLLRVDVRDRAVVFQGNRLITFAPGVSDLADLTTVVGMLHDVAALVPPFLVNDLGDPETR
jgi:hypothetical protein